MPVVVAFAIWLYFRHRRAYALVRNAFLASGAIAIVIYAAYPVAPPRLLPDAGFIDTMAVYDRVGYQTQESKAFVNPFAAMPSLHFGWSLLLGVMVARVGRRPAWMLAGIAWPIAMFFSIVLTANHWIVDAVAGGVVSFAGLGIAVVIDRRIWPAIHARWDRLAHGESGARPLQRLPERISAAAEGDSDGG
jgi:membrane-associated phospholipid phosphatase